MTRTARFVLLLVPLAVLGAVLALCVDREDADGGVAAVPVTALVTPASPAPAKEPTLLARLDDVDDSGESSEETSESAPEPTAKVAPPVRSQRVATAGGSNRAQVGPQLKNKRRQSSGRSKWGRGKAKRSTPAMRGLKFRGPNAKGTPLAPPKSPGKAKITAPVAPMRVVRPNKHLKNKGRKIRNPARKARRKS